MIRLRLSFGPEHKGDLEVDIIDGELLSHAVRRVTDTVPMSGHTIEEVFKAVVNGHIIEPDFWAFTKLRPIDSVLIIPDIKSGDSGQIFKQAAILAIVVVASYFLTPATGATLASTLGVAAVSIGATLLLNGLIPPPVPSVGDLGGIRGYEDSQMYSIGGQSNQAKRFENVPKLYGKHRMFPNVCATPYAQLEVDPDTGELVQYLYAIYDFGLGPISVDEVKIGDTPLTDDNFREYQYRFVDLNKPPDGDPEEANLLYPLRPTFELYKGDNEGTPLAIGLDGNNFNSDPIDTWEAIRNTAPNTDGSGQEIILNFTNPGGLYGFNSIGGRSYRQIELDISFSKIDEDIWRKYNDETFVSDFQAVGGGTSAIDFIAAAGRFFNKSAMIASGVYESNGIFERPAGGVHLKPGNKILVYDIGDLAIGSAVFAGGNTFIGNIASVEDYLGFKRVTLDRSFTYKETMFLYSTDFGELFGEFHSPFAKFRIHTQSIGRGTIKREDINPVYSSFRFTPKDPGQYKVRVQRLFTQGPYNTTVQDHLLWSSLTTRFKRPPVITDKRHTFMEIKVKATNQFNGTISDLSGVCYALVDVYDPDTLTWDKRPSSNPAWIFADLLTGEVNKRPIPKDRLHLPSLLEWADFCDEVPTPPEDQEYTFPRFECNFILDYSAALQAVLNQVAGGAQASLNIIEGKYGVLIDRLKTVPVQIFTPRNSTNFQSSRIYGSRPHALKVKYIDPNIDWQVTELVVFDDGYDDETATDFDDMISFACTNNEQAWRFGRYMIAQNKLRQETINIQVDFENLVCTRGDFVQITQDVMRVGGFPARVKTVAGTIITIDDHLDLDLLEDYGYVYRAADGDINTSTLTPISPNTYDLDGAMPAPGDLIIIGIVGQIVFDCIVKSITPNDDMSAQVTLVEKADAIYAYESSGTIPEYDPQISTSSDPNLSPPNEVENLAVADSGYECSAKGEGYDYFVDLVWDIPLNSIYEFFTVYVDNGKGFSEIANTRTTLYRYISDEAFLGTEHSFKVVAISATGNKLALGNVGSVESTPMSKTAPPSDVEELGANITNEILQLTWPLIPDCDTKEYVVRYSTDIEGDWDTSVSLSRVGKSTNSILTQARTGSYFVKAVDFNGNVSTNAAIAITTIPTLFNLNEIEIIEEFSPFPGEFVQTIEDDSAIILQKEVIGGPGIDQYYAEGYYNYYQILDLGEVFTVRLQSLVDAVAYTTEPITITHEDWDIEVQYRTSAVLDVISEWVTLSSIAFMAIGDGADLSEWRTFIMGDATGRVFQFRIHLISNNFAVTPKVLTTKIRADMTDRIESFENLMADTVDGYILTYDAAFAGPTPSPNVQISVEDAATGDYWSFDYKTLSGFQVRFYDNTDSPVARQFDAMVKGFGRVSTDSI